jgi:hypothetical protein
MSTSETAPSASSPPAQPRDEPTNPPAGEAPGDDLDPEEDVAPNLGGEDRMQDA